MIPRCAALSIALTATTRAFFAPSPSPLAAAVRTFFTCVFNEVRVPLLRRVFFAVLRKSFLLDFVFAMIDF
jgi:hypothetical protein